MARLRPASPVEDAARARGHWSPETSAAGGGPARRLRGPRRLPDDTSSSDEASQCKANLVPRISPKKTKGCRQIKLNSLGSLSTATMLRCEGIEDDPSRPSRAAARVYRPRPRSKQTQNALLSDTNIRNTGRRISLDSEEEGSSYSDAASSDLETSDDSLPSLDQLISLPPRKAMGPSSRKHDLSSLANDVSTLTFREILNGSRPEPEVGAREGALQSQPSKIVTPLSRLSFSSDKENSGGVLHYSPPRLCTSPPKTEIDRPVTPPPKTNRPRLQSPSKSRTRVPTPPHRQSLEAFWDPDEINDWNDQYSPQKTLRSPKKLFDSREDSDASPSASPKKLQSPSKRTRAEVIARKDFAAQKHGMAEAFLRELDDIVADGQIGQLAAPTGGVRFIWSKTLNSTAGRANWRRETIKTSRSNGTVDVTHKHHASIELAEKVIDDADRLLNVIAHEFCHLCNFMISGIKDQPHGAQFKAWGRKCTLAFQARGIKVTTKHTYAIDYKYIWRCSNDDCAAEFKRHSKSIDPVRHTCGSCRSRIVQIKPVPRKDAGGGAKGYAAYVKEHFAAVRRDLPGATQKEIMEAIGRKYRAEKSVLLQCEGGDVEASDPPSRPSTVVDVEKVAVMLEVIAIDDA